MITITGKQLLGLCEDDDGFLVPKSGIEIYDHPNSGVIRYPCKIEEVEDTDDGVWFRTEEFECVIEGDDDTIEVMIYKLIDIESLDELME
jgi:hypothetical protein